MSQSLTRAREQSDGFQQYLLASYYLAAGNLSVTTMAFGVLLVVLGRTVITGTHAVFGAMFGIWGASFVLLGAIAYAVLLANRVIARLTD